MLAPSLHRVTIRFNATSPPNRDALQHVDELLTAAVDMGAIELEKVFQFVRSAFRRSGNYGLLFDLDDVLGAAGAGAGAGALDLNALRDAALVLRGFVRAAAEDLLAAPEVGRKLLDAVGAIVRAIGVDVTQAECVITARCVEDGVDYNVALEGVDGEVRYLFLHMVGPPEPSTTGQELWERKDSYADGCARTLFGLSGLLPVELSVVADDADPFDSWGDGDGVNELASSLALLSDLDTLRFDIGEDAVGPGLLVAIREPVLNALTHIYVTRAALDSTFMAAGRPKHLEGWFDALELAVTSRSNHGLQLQRLEIAGHFCLCMLWVRRVREVVGEVVLNVTCMNRVRSVCLTCDFVPWW
ncbi:unnamed protein product [Peniophora sp. CBMAI 1063]|nr:unnamed protein product [Peniophora sp. CBMAI 1063]